MADAIVLRLMSHVLNVGMLLVRTYAYCFRSERGQVSETSQLLKV